MMENITASDFQNFKVCDGAEACAACGTAKAAPIIIKGAHYCLWCALDIARSLLVRHP